MVLGDDPAAGIAQIVRLRTALPEVAVVEVDALGPEDALAAVGAGAWDTTLRDADPRIVTLALRRALSCAGTQRELRALRAQAGNENETASPAELAPEPVHSLRELERDAIRKALAATGGRVGQAAKLLGMGRATRYRRLATGEPRDAP